MKLKEIHRTSTFAWSPYASLPLLATGTVAGALDESFSNESQLEIWAPDFLDKDEYDLGREGLHGPKAFVTDNARYDLFFPTPQFSNASRFNRLAWGSNDSAHPQGVIAAGLENGELVLWDPAKILAGSGFVHVFRDCSAVDRFRTASHRLSCATQHTQVLFVDWTSIPSKGTFLRQAVSTARYVVF